MERSGRREQRPRSGPPDDRLESGRDVRWSARRREKVLRLRGESGRVAGAHGRLPDGDEQGLQQFIADSPWDDAPVWRRLARRMTAEIGPGAG
jgi:hypothetical protein